MADGGRAATTAAACVAATIATAAIVQIAATLAAMLRLAPTPVLQSIVVPGPLVVLQVFAFGGAGLVLVTGHARDARTFRLGVLLLVVASAFTVRLGTGGADAPLLVRLAAAVHPDALLAWCVGRFILVFPQTRQAGRVTRALTVLVALAALVGALLAGANLLALDRGYTPVNGWLARLARTHSGGTFYWTTNFALIAGMLPLSFAGTGRLDQNTRRRVRVFLFAFLAGLGPTVAVLILAAMPGLGPPVSIWLARPGALAFFQVCLATIPLTVAYAVLVQRVLPVRVVARLALQYLLARWTLTAAFVIPASLVVVEGYLRRHQTIVEAIAGPRAWLVAATVVAGVVMFLREDIRRAIDRWFFRDACDAREILVTLGAQSRQAQRLDELIVTLTSGIDRAFRPESLAVLVRSDTGTHFVSPFGAVEPLAASSVVAGAIAAARGPIDVRMDDGESPLRWLPREERQWLVDSRAALVVPMRGANGWLAGALLIGERRSEMPFSREDRWLVAAIADAGALTIENHVMHAATDGRPVADESWRVGLVSESAQAFECGSCGLIHTIGATTCARCDGSLRPADVPPVLFGKFRFEERVGRGGMGVVYRAVDLALDRVVAIKTLPGTSPEHSQRLRLEARAMAAVTHPHLAIIHGAESWRGQPMLIFEFMSQGTLAARLSSGPLPLADAIGLGIALADALAVIHAAGLLHRDIKPSNIGFGGDGVPKLLDFGLVHLLSTSPLARHGDDHVAGIAFAGGNPLTSLSLTQPCVGTPLYLSPEASGGGPPSAAFDLWSLHVLLIEAITGRHPFRGTDVQDTMRRIRQARLDATWAAGQSLPRAVVSHFERALARDSARRLRSATDVSSALHELARSA